MSVDLVELSGILLGLFAVGYMAGFLVQALRRFLEHV